MDEGQREAASEGSRRHTPRQRGYEAGVCVCWQVGTRLHNVSILSSLGNNECAISLVTRVEKSTKVISQYPLRESWRNTGGTTAVSYKKRLFGLSHKLVQADILKGK